MSLEALVTILGMALATFAIRAGGLLLANRLPQGGFAAAWLKHLPGAVLASLVAPAVASGGTVEMLGAAGTAAAFLVTRSLFVAMAAGVGMVFLIRMALGA